MRTTLRRRLAVLGGAGLLAATVGVATGVTPANAGTQANTNSCQNNATGTFGDLSVTLSGTASPSPATLGGAPVVLSSGNIALDVPPSTLVAGYNFGLLTTGVNVIPVTVDVTILGTNTAEGSTTLTVSGSGTTTITDPDGTPGNGNESATPFAISAPLPDTTWTPTGGTIEFKDGGSTSTAVVGTPGVFTLDVIFVCVPGTSIIDPVSGDGVGVTPSDPTPFETVTVVAPPAPPVANDDTSSVGAGQSVTINVVNNDTDQNGDLDPTSVAVVASPAGGNLTNNGDGTLTYDNTDGAIGTDTFTYTVSDGVNGPSNVATVTIQVFGDLCDATAAPCPLSQVLIVPVIGTSMTLEQDGLGNQFQVTMIDFDSIGPGLDGIVGTADDDLSGVAPVFLDGTPKLAVGNLYQMTVTNARGTDDPWSLTGQVTEFTDGTAGADGCIASDDSTWNNHCIPGDNLGWIPSADVAHVEVNGDVADVTAGVPLFTYGLPGVVDPLTITGLATAPATLCSAAAGTSGGTFTCDANLGLTVPASAAAGTYVARLTLTLA